MSETKVKYSFNFLDLPTQKSPRLDLYKSYFTEYDPLKWKKGSGGGCFKFFDGRVSMFSLVISEDSSMGIMLVYEHRNKKERRTIEKWVSIGSKELLGTFKENEEEQKVSSGAYMQPHDAWMAVAEFMSNPTNLPKSITWISALDLNRLNNGKEQD